MKGTVRNRVGMEMRKRLKCFAFFIAVFLLALSMGESISASEGDRKLGFILSYDADGESLSGVAAVAMMMGEGQIGIFGSTSIVDEDAASYVFVGDQEFTAEYQGMESDTDSALFIVATDAADTRFLDYDSAGEGEAAYLHYLCRDGNLTENTLSITVTGYEKLEEKGYYILDYSASQKDVEEMQETGFYLPGAVLNDAGKLVGILTPSLDIITYYLEEGRFSGNAEPSSGGNLFPDDGGSSEEIKGRADELIPTAEPTAAPTTEPTAVPTAEATAAPTAEPTAVPTAETGSVTSFPFGIIGGAAMVAGGLILFLCGLNAMKKRKKAVQETGKEIPPTMPVKEKVDRQEIPPTIPVEEKADRHVPDIDSSYVGLPKPDVPPAEPKPVRLYLCCEGGVMDGRRYLVTADGLLIGRAPECNICYPPDTRGVSMKHCRLFWNKGVLMLMDLGSTNGTFIRGKGQMGANVPVAVIAGDTFYLGEKKNAFSIRME